MTAYYRGICKDQMKRVHVNVLNNEASFEQLQQLGMLLQMAFDLEQGSKVFDDTIRHTQVNMARVKHHHEQEKKEHRSRTNMGFIREDEDLEDEYYEDELE